MGESKPEQEELARRFFEALHEFGERERELVTLVVGSPGESRMVFDRTLRGMALGFLVYRLVHVVGASSTRDVVAILIDLAEAFEKRGASPPVHSL